MMFYHFGKLEELDVPVHNVEYVKPATSHTFPFWLPLSILNAVCEWWLYVDDCSEAKDE